MAASCSAAGASAFVFARRGMFSIVAIQVRALCSSFPDLQKALIISTESTFV